MDSQVENELFFAKNCKHLFIEDYIDCMNPYREGIFIKYCEYCGLDETYVEFLIEKEKKCKKLKKEK